MLYHNLLSPKCGTSKLKCLCVDCESLVHGLPWGDLVEKILDNNNKVWDSSNFGKASAELHLSNDL